MLWACSISYCLNRWDLRASNCLLLVVFHIVSTLCNDLNARSLLLTTPQIVDLSLEFVDGQWLTIPINSVYAML